MSDLVKRLREAAKWTFVKPGDITSECEAMSEAADEIERLEMSLRGLKRIRDVQ